MFLYPLADFFNESPSVSALTIMVRKGPEPTKVVAFGGYDDILTPRSVMRTKPTYQ